MFRTTLRNTTKKNVVVYGSTKTHIVVRKTLYSHNEMDIRRMIQEIHKDMDDMFYQLTSDSKSDLECFIDHATKQWVCGTSMYF